MSCEGAIRLEIASNTMIVARLHNGNCKLIQSDSPLTHRRHHYQPDNDREEDFDGDGLTEAQEEDVYGTVTLT